MKRQFWGGTSEIHQSYLNARINAFFDDFKSCLEIINPLVAKLSCLDVFSVVGLQSAGNLTYFFSWLEKEGLENIKCVADFDARTLNTSFERILDDCIFILEETKEQEDKEVACANLADVIMYLSKAVKTITQSKDVSSEIRAVTHCYPLEFTKKMTPIRDSGNFELTTFDLDFENELPVAA